ncbi:MAG: hypothetical protein ACR2NP_18970 [Pirellulaceae bacterium]
MKPDRRTALATALSGGIAWGLCETAHAQEPVDLDRQAVLAAGMNEKEAECWKLTAEAAGKFFELEELHPLDNSEVATAIHVIQQKLLARPTYRKYLEEAKRLRQSDD